MFDSAAMGSESLLSIPRRNGNGFEEIRWTDTAVVDENTKDKASRACLASRAEEASGGLWCTPLPLILPCTGTASQSARGSVVLVDVCVKI